MAVVTLFPSSPRPDTRVRGFEWRPHAIGDAIDFGDAQMPDEHAEILALRLGAHQHYGHLPGYMAADLASPFDAYARHLVCRSKGRIVGYVRLIHQDGDPAKSQYVTLGKHEIPGWLWQAGFIEANAGATEPEFRGSGLFLALMQHAVYVARKLGHRYFLGACEDELVGRYCEMGFTAFDPRNVEPLPGWRFRSHLILLDMDTLLRTPPEGKWVQAMVLAVSSAEISLGTSTNAVTLA